MQRVAVKGVYGGLAGGFNQTGDFQHCGASGYIDFDFNGPVLRLQYLAAHATKHGKMI
ncbi:MAG: hypothetical protein VCA12_05340 [Pseudomonadales bacterium]|jgi:hypothetical protein